MGKTKKRIVAFLLIATCLFATLCGLVGAQRSTAAADEAPLDRIGATVPSDTEFYNQLTQYLAGELSKNYILDFVDCEQDSAKQIEQIETFIAQNYAAIIVAPVDPDGIATVLKKADKADIKIIVIGMPHGDYPRDTVFVYQDYFKLGKAHADWVLGESNIDEIENIRLFYTPDDEGKDYWKGFQSVLEQYPDLMNRFAEVPISEDDELLQWIEDWIDDFDYDKRIRNEMVTCFGSWASIILNAYYNNGYIDSSSGRGTGIRALPDPQYSGVDDGTAKAFADAICDATTHLLNGEELISNLYEIPFASAISKHVD